VVGPPQQQPPPGGAASFSLFGMPAMKRSRQVTVKDIWTKEREALQRWWATDPVAVSFRLPPDQVLSQGQCFDMWALLGSISAFGFTQVTNQFERDFVFHIVGLFFGNYLYFDARGFPVADVTAVDPSEIASVQYVLNLQKHDQPVYDSPEIVDRFSNDPQKIAQAFFSCLFQTNFSLTPQQEEHMLATYRAVGRERRAQDIEQVVSRALLNAIDWYAASSLAATDEYATYELSNVSGDGSCFFKAVGVSIFYHLTSGYAPPTVPYCRDSPLFGATCAPLQEYDSVELALVNILGSWLKFYTFIVLATKIPFAHISWYGGITGVEGIEPITDYMAYEKDIDGTLLAKITEGRAIPSLNVVVRRLIYLLLRQPRAHQQVEWSILKPYLGPLMMIPWRAPALMSAAVNSAAAPPANKVFRYYDTIRDEWVNVSVELALRSSDEYQDNWRNFYAAAQRMCSWGGAGEALVLAALLSTDKDRVEKDYGFLNVFIYVPMTDALGPEGLRSFGNIVPGEVSPFEEEAEIAQLTQQLNQRATYYDLMDTQIMHADQEITVYRRGGHYQTLLSKPEGRNSPILAPDEILRRTEQWLRDADTRSIAFPSWTPPTVPERPNQRPASVVPAAATPPPTVSFIDLTSASSSPVVDAFGVSSTADVLDALRMSGAAAAAAVPTTPPAAVIESPTTAHDRQQELFTRLMQQTVASFGVVYARDLARRILDPAFITRVAAAARTETGLPVNMAELERAYATFLNTSSAIQDTLRNSVLATPRGRAALLQFLNKP